MISLCYKIMQILQKLHLRDMWRDIKHFSHAHKSTMHTCKNFQDNIIKTAVIKTHETLAQY